MRIDIADPMKFRNPYDFLGALSTPVQKKSRQGISGPPPSIAQPLSPAVIAANGRKPVKQVS
jgi:hypothetical protein